MRSITHFLLILMFVILFHSCGSSKMSSTKISRPIIIDGQSKDWNDIPLTYLEDLEMVIGFAHDDNTLYAMFRFSDARLAHTIHRRGAILWLDPQNNEEKKWGIRYQRQFGDFPNERNNRQRPESPPEVHLDGQFMIVQGEDQLSTGLEYFNGVAAANGKDKNLYLFEFAIPLNAGYDNVLGQLTSATKKVSMGIELGAVNDVEKQMMQRQFDEGAGNRPRGGGRGGPGMRGGGRPGGRDAGRTSEMGEQEVWITVQLAKS